MKLINTNCNKWDKEINISLSLKELQIIHDAHAVTSYHGCREYWDDGENSGGIPYVSDEFYSLYDDLEDAVRTLGGYTDDCR